MNFELCTFFQFAICREPSFSAALHLQFCIYTPLFSPSVLFRVLFLIRNEFFLRILVFPRWPRVSFIKCDILTGWILQYARGCVCVFFVEIVEFQTKVRSLEEK